MTFDYHSCENCQFLFHTYEGGIICNAFHTLDSDWSTEKENSCSDFEQAKPYNRFIACPYPEQDELNSLSDKQVNSFNESFGTCFEVESMEVSDFEESVSLTLVTRNPFLLLRANGECPIWIVNLYNGEKERLDIVRKHGVRDWTDYFCGQGVTLQLEVENNYLMSIEASRYPVPRMFSAVEGIRGSR